MNLFELFVKVGVDDQASDKLKTLGGKLGSGLKTAAKIGTAAVGAAAAGITALTTAAVKNYAEYEQLVGGVDTLFKKSSQKVQQYAAEAYRTSGMSANDYMANATAFSASLISSLGGDTEKAAEYANRAMVSMSDNANKMGTSLDSIVQTYQSLSRGNMAMLDNLKLGYGGTKAELERLIKDAASYTDIQKEMGITVDASSMSFDNIVNAIAVVQGKLGIAGATALEAGTTIEGSVNSMKAAWSNLVTGIADDNADFGKLIDNFVTTIVGDGTDKNAGVFGNLLPRIEEALYGVDALIYRLFPIVMQRIPAIINDFLPDLVETATMIVQSFVDGISQNQEMLMKTATEIITYLATSLISMLPQIVQLGLDLIISLANGIAESLPELIPTIVDVILQIVDTLTSPDTLSNLIDAAIAIIMGLADGIITALPRLIDKVPDIIENLVQAIVDNLPKIVVAGIELMIKLGEAIFKARFQLASKVPEIIMTLINGFVSYFYKFAQVGKDFILKVKEGFSDKVDSAKTWGKDLIDNFINGIKEKWQKLKQTVSNVAQSVKDFLGFSEPKKGPLSNFHTYAPDMMDLFIKGIKDNEDNLLNQVSDTFDFRDEMGFGDTEYGITTSSTSIGDFSGGSTRYGSSGSQNVNVTVGIDNSANAMGLARALLPFLKIAEKEVYA